MSDGKVHLPVMVGEVVAHLDCRPGKLYVDATVGAGGHGAAILEASGPDGYLVGIDQDLDVLTIAGETLGRYAGRFNLVHGNFRDLPAIIDRCGRGPADGLLFDLGISSWQIDSPERGFSFRADAPLDMRMDRSRGRTAAELIRNTRENELKKMIRDYGEEPRAGRIARVIKEASEQSRGLTTTELATAVEGVLGSGWTRGRRKIHPATRTFQALRIAVNDELQALKDLLDDLPELLNPAGRCCSLAYHSLEDRLVKNAFRDLAGRGMDRREPVVKVLTKKPLRPGEEEVQVNPRARSARLRAIRKLEG